MYIEVSASTSVAPYPRPSILQSPPSPTASFSNGGNMGANNNANVDGVGALNYQRAIDIARNTEGELDPTVEAYLEQAVGDIWRRIAAQPDRYILTRDEFAVFNFYIRRFQGVPAAERAVARYWQYAREPA